jgi:hypothetical protein
VDVDAATENAARRKDLTGGGEGGFAKWGAGFRSDANILVRLYKDFSN